MEEEVATLGIACQHHHEDEGREERTAAEDQNHSVLEFLDSLDDYLSLMDSLSSTLRKAWFELASARHSMGASRINGALLDLKEHPAATHLHINGHCPDSTLGWPQFCLCKWASSTNNGECSVGEEKSSMDKLQGKSDCSLLRCRGPAQFTDFQEEEATDSGAGSVSEDLIQRQRARSLSMFGTLVSPKLRAAQLSFETALGTLVEIANKRLSMQFAHDEVEDKLKEKKR